MSDEDIAIGGKLLKEMKVAELKKHCKDRNLPIGGNKSSLIKRLKVAIELEDLKKSALNSESGNQPNLDIADNPAENEIVKQYLENQRKMLQKQQHRFSSASEPDSEEDAPKRKFSRTLSSNLSDAFPSPQATESVAEEKELHSGAEEVEQQPESVQDQDEIKLKKNNADSSEEISESETKDDVDVTAVVNAVEKQKPGNDTIEMQKISKSETPKNNQSENKIISTEESCNDLPKKNVPVNDEKTDYMSTEETISESHSPVIVKEQSTVHPDEQKDSSSKISNPDQPEESFNFEQNASNDKENDRKRNVNSDINFKSSIDISLPETNQEDVASKQKDDTVSNREIDASNVVDEQTEEECTVPNKEQSAISTVQSETKDVEGVPVISMEADTLMEEEEELDYDETELDKSEVHNESAEKNKHNHGSSKKKRKHREKSDKSVEESPQPKKQRKLKRSLRNDSPVKEDKVKSTGKNDEKPLDAKRSASPISDTVVIKSEEKHPSSEEPIVEKEEEKPPKRRISIKKNPIKRSMATDQPREKKRKWGKSTSSDSSHINISTDYLKNIIDVKKGAIDEEVVDLESPSKKKIVTERKEESEEEEGEIVEEVIVEEEVREEQDAPVEEKNPSSDSRKVVKSEKIKDKSPVHEKPAKRERKQSYKSESTSKHQAAIKKHGSDRHRDVSPARMPVSCILHVSELVRPFALSQLKQLLNEQGEFIADSFWINNIKSHCFVKYENEEIAVKTRNALHGLQWPTSSPKKLKVDFSTPEEVEWNKKEQPIRPLKPPKKKRAEAEALKEQQPIQVSRKDSRPVDHEEKNDKRDKQRSSRHEKESSRKGRERSSDRSRHHIEGRREHSGENRRERRREERDDRDSRSVREWDMHKLDQDEEIRKQQRREERRREERPVTPPPRKKREEEAPKPPPEPPKLLDDLFRKTEATPPVYWLPLTEEQVFERDKERERRRSERAKLRQEEDAKKEDKEKKDERTNNRAESRDDERRRDERKREERARIEPRSGRREPDPSRGKREDDQRSNVDSKRRDEKEADSSRSRGDRENLSKPTRRRKESSSSSSSDSSNSDSSGSSGSSDSSSSSSDSEKESSKKGK